MEKMLLTRQNAPDTIRLEFGIRSCHSQRLSPAPAHRYTIRPTGSVFKIFSQYQKYSLYANHRLHCTISTRRPMAGDIQLTCSDCGQDFTFTAADQAFFQERGYSTPKRCKTCRQAKKNDQGGSGYRSAPAQGTPVICSGCGQPTTVPFEPRGDRPVFCRDCYQARKGSGGGGGGSSRGRGRF
ncbi:MAG: zinc-ribbon domain containing protein [Terracidiphilus sp.]